MIIASQISKSYGDTVVVDGVTVSIPAGGVTSIIGPNGAGKSTLLSIVARLMSMDAGTVTVDGLDVTKTPSDTLAKRLSILRQDNHISSRLTVRDLVGFGRYPYSRAAPPSRTRSISTGRWTISISKILPAVFWTNFPAASASAPSWPWCCVRIRITCFSTSRSTIST